MTSTGRGLEPSGAGVAFTQTKDGMRAEYEYLRRLERSLQAATPAEADGADVEMVVAALVHDLGDELAPDNHSQPAAAIVRPCARSEVTRVIEMHSVFQTVYYGEHVGLDPNARDAYRDHEWFDSCATFCERWDQSYFDPDYPTKALEHFEPMLRKVFGRTPFDPATGCR